METVFDHNITDKEREDIGVTKSSKEEYLKFAGKDTANVDLAFLFSNRGNNKKAEYYANKLPDLMKLDCLRTIHHS